MTMIYAAAFVLTMCYLWCKWFFESGESAQSCPSTPKKKKKKNLKCPGAPGRRRNGSPRHQLGPRAKRVLVASDSDSD